MRFDTPSSFRKSVSTDLLMSQECPDDEELPKSLWAALGMPDPVFRDESFAPTVDRELLTRLVRSELSEPEARAAYRLIHSFKSWTTAHTEILIAEYHRNRPEES
jgi:hypothetical protein